MSDVIRLMLVDDHAVVRAGLKSLFDLQEDLSVVAESDTTRDVLRKIDEARPDVLVIDLTLPGGGSLELIRALRGRPDAPKVLVLTMHDAVPYARAALAAGAIGYVVKTLAEADVLAAVRAVSHGRIFIDLDDARATAEIHAQTVLPGGTTELSERELEVLSLLGHGFSNLEIAEKLDISAKTVATYKARIGDKVGLKTTADFVKYAADNGLLR
jgi:two-component system, NarL family, response regulator NreC